MIRLQQALGQRGYAAPIPLRKCLLIQPALPVALGQGIDLLVPLLHRVANRTHTDSQPLIPSSRWLAQMLT